MTTIDTPRHAETSATSENVISTLADLIQICRDGEEGFRQAAEHADDGNLRMDLLRYSQQRRRFVTELQQFQRNSGETEVDTKGSVAGTLHRTWIGIRDAVTSKYDDQAILDEAERGEDYAVAAYKKALEDSALPSDVQDVIRAQYAMVQEAHDHVKAMRDANQAVKDSAA